MSQEYRHKRTSVTLLNYHFVWIPARRKKVLMGDVAKRLRELCVEVALEQEWTILNLAIQPDHVHLFVRVFPTNAASEVVKEVKGFTAHELRAKYPVLKRLPSLWTRSYFASTAGKVSQETIERYIAAQKGK